MVPVTVRTKSAAAPEVRALGVIDVMAGGGDCAKAERETRAKRAGLRFFNAVASGSKHSGHTIAQSSISGTYL